MDEGLVDSKHAVVAHQDAAIVLQPGKGALDFPALAVAAQLAPILEAPLHAVRSIGHAEVGAALPQAATQRITIVAAIRNDPPQAGARSSSPRPRHPYPRQRALRQLVLGRAGGRELYSQRNALAIDHHHALRALATAGFAHSSAPFLAVMKVASRKASFQSSNLRRSISANSCCQACNQTPCSSQCCRRRQQVTPLGYGRGTSRQRAPLRSTHRMPSQQARLQAQGRPRWSRRLRGGGKKCSIFAHCLSLSTMLTLNHHAPLRHKYQLRGRTYL